MITKTKRIIAFILAVTYSAMLIGTAILGMLR